MSIEVLTPENFRKMLAGHTDNLRELQDTEYVALEDEIVKFISILPELFSDDFDRKTLWERIGNGISSSISKSSGELEIFINNCLEYIKADSGKVAANENLNSFIQMLPTRPKEWKECFLTISEKKHYILIVKARTRWNLNKGAKT